MGERGRISVSSPFLSSSISACTRIADRGCTTESVKSTTTFRLLTRSTSTSVLTPPAMPLAVSSDPTETLAWKEAYSFNYGTCKGKFKLLLQFAEAE
jgi:hypothetical protein